MQTCKQDRHLKEKKKFNKKFINFVSGFLFVRLIFVCFFFGVCFVCDSCSSCIHFSYFIELQMGQEISLDVPRRCILMNILLYVIKLDNMSYTSTLSILLYMFNISDYNFLYDFFFFL